MGDDRILRLRQLDLDESLDSGYAPPPDCPPSLLAITAGTTGGSAAAFYAMHATEIDGAEVEGGAGTYSDDSTTFHAFNIGSGVPPVGTRVLTHHLGGRWVFQYDAPA